MNAPPTERSPFALGKSKEQQEFFYTASRYSNQRLAALASELRLTYPDAQFFLYDTHTFMISMLDAPLNYGLVHTSKYFNPLIMIVLNADRFIRDSY